MDSGPVAALPATVPEGSRMVEITRAICAPLPWLSTSVRIWIVASPERTWVRTNVPHRFAVRAVELDTDSPARVRIWKLEDAAIPADAGGRVLASQRVKSFA